MKKINNPSGKGFLFPGPSFLLNLSFFLFLLHQFPAGAQINSSYRWTWIGGSASTSQVGIYGQKQVENSSNRPGARAFSAYWTDNAGNFWLFGGYGVASNSTGTLNDLWRYNVSTGFWTWMAGDSVPNAPAFSSALNVESPQNTPNARESCGYWTSSDGKDLYLYGGFSNYSGYFEFNDVWAFNTITNKWRYVKFGAVNGAGNCTGQFNGGTGIFTASTWNVCTYAPLCATTPSGFAFLFGGNGGNTNWNHVTGFSDYNFSPSDLVSAPLQWASFISPNEALTWGPGGQTGNYSGSTPYPGGRFAGNAFFYGGKLHFFGGRGLGQQVTGNNPTGNLNDLWRYDGRESGTQKPLWTFLKGATTVNNNGTYGTMGVPGSGNFPASRYHSNLKQTAANQFVMFGGIAANNGYLNDVWSYDPASNNWTWLKGSSSDGAPTVWGALGVQSNLNQLGGRAGAAMWVSRSGEVYVFGGLGVPGGFFNDLWKLSAPVEPTTISSFSPTSASTGVTVTISGNHFNGATAVSFGGTPASSFTVINNTTITAVVAGGASGSVSVTTSRGTATLAGFTYCSLTPVFTVDGPFSGQSFCQGTPINFTIGFTQNGGTSPVFQWRKNGVNIPGAIGTSFSSSTLADNDVISCVMTSSLSCANPQSVVSANTIAVRIKPLPAPVLAVSGSCIGNTTISLTGADSSFAIRWQKDNITQFERAIAEKVTDNIAFGLFMDQSGNLYVTEGSNHRVQKWAPGATSGVTVAGGNGAGAAANQLRNPRSVFVDAAGNVFVVDGDNHRVQKWAPGATSGITVAGGNGQGNAPNQLNFPWGLYIDNSGNLFVCDNSNHRVQRWAPGATAGTTVAGGNGQGAGANQFSFPGGLWLDLSGNIYVADAVNHRIQKWVPGAASGSTVAGGNGGGAAPNQLLFPKSVCLDQSGNIYVSDDNNELRKWTPGATSGTTIAGGTLGGDVGPNALFVNRTGTQLYTAAGSGVFRWNIPLDYPTVIYTPVAAGDYRAEVTARNGCTAFSNTVSVLNTLPSLSAPLANQGKNPRIVSDIARCSTTGSRPAQIVRTGTKILFTADSTGVSNSSLWVSDGTRAGTIPLSMASQLNPAKKAASPFALTATTNGKVFFRSKTAVNNAGDIWVTDSSGNTILLDEFTPPHATTLGDDINFLIAIGNQVYYNAETNDGRWVLKKSDGTLAGTTVVRDFGTSDGIGGLCLGAVMNNQLYFDFYNTPSSGQDELWVSDGTAAGTRLVYNLGADGGLVSQLMPSGGNLFFLNFKSGAIQLWKTNGTGAGTGYVRLISGSSDFNIQFSNYYPAFTSTSGPLLLSLNNGINGKEPWVCGSDSAGTYMLKDINPGAGGSQAFGFTVVGNKLYFAADNGSNGMELWVAPFPAIRDSAVMVKDLNPGAGIGVNALGNIAGSLYFSGNDGISGFELWTSEGNDSSTVQVADIQSGSGSSSPGLFAGRSDIYPAYFAATVSATGRELYRLDQIDKIWRGKNNNLWSNAANWSPIGIPTINDNVLVPKVPLFSNILVDINAFCNDLWINPGTGLQVQSGRTLTVSGR